jgi:hypothetical protein
MTMDPILALLEQLRGTAAAADPELRQRAADACRSILAVLEAPAPSAGSEPPTGTATDPLGALLEGIIARYSPLLPENLPPIPALAIPFVPVPGKE